MHVNAPQMEPTQYPRGRLLSQRGGGRALPWVAGLLLGVVASVTVWTLIQPPDPLTTRFTVEPPPGVQFVDQAPIYKISPDGRTVAFQGVSENSNQLYLRRLDQLEAFPLRGAEGTRPVSFSPDGQSLLVLDAGRNGFPRPPGAVKRVLVTGGPPTTVLHGSGGTAWGPENTFVLGSNAGLMLIRQSGGEATPLTTPSEDELGHFAPTSLPNGRGVLFFAPTIPGLDSLTSQVAVYDLETGEWTNLLSGTTPFFATTGHLVFWRDDSLWAAPFDLDRLEVRGDPVEVVESVGSFNVGVASYAVADNGTLVYQPGGDRTITTLGWVNREGVMTTPLVEGPVGPRLSPGGTHLVFQRQDEALWIRNLESGRETRLTEGAGGARAVWTPDDTAVTFSGLLGHNLYLRPADNSSPAQMILPTEFPAAAGSWTPDGQTLIYDALSSQGGRNIWTLSVGGEPAPFLATEFNEQGPRLSPDGKWLAYVSDQPGEDRVYVQAFPEGGSVYTVSAGPGTEAVWSRDGRELFYRNGNQMWAVEVETEPDFVAGRSELLFEAPYQLGSGPPTYDVSLDGQQFLMVRQGSAAEQTPPLIVVEHWTEELKRLVPTDK